MRRLFKHSETFYLFSDFLAICVSVMGSHPISGLCKRIRLCAVFVAGMRETACSLCDGLWICVDVRARGGGVWVWGVVCSCVLKPQAMKPCVSACVSHYVCAFACMRVCVCVCKGGERVGECRRQTCQLHSWFLWLQGSDQSRVTLGITALWNTAWGEHTIIFWRQTHTNTQTHTHLVGCPHP